MRLMFLPHLPDVINVGKGSYLIPQLRPLAGGAVRGGLVDRRLQRRGVARVHQGGGTQVGTPGCNNRLFEGVYY